MLSLLYIDDEPGLLEIAQLYLESGGEFTVTTALSAETGLRHLAQQDFDAIVSDYQMPGMDGIEFFKNVRKSFGNIPFVLLTDRGMEQVVINAINNGVDFYIRKGGDPRVQLTEIAHSVRQAVSRHRAEIALLDSEKRRSELINSLPDAAFAIDNSGKVIAWNYAIERMTGVATADILGKGNYEYALPFYGKRRPLLIDLISGPEEVLRRDYTNVTRDGNTLSAETGLSLVKGRRLYILASAGPLYNRQGETVGAIEVIRDFTDRKKDDDELWSAYEQITANEKQLRQQLDDLAATQTALRKSEEKFRDIVEKSPDLIWEIDTDGFFTYMSPQSTDLIGYTPPEIIGKTVFSIVPGDALPPFVELLSVSIRTKKAPKEFDLPIRCRDGHEIILEMRAVAQRDSSGRVIGFRGTARDSTEKRKAASELQSANKLLVANVEELRAQYDKLAEGEGRIREALLHGKDQLLSDAFASIRDGISILDTSMTVMRVNPTMEKWYARELPLVGRKCWEVYCGRSERCEVCPSDRALQTGKPAHDIVPFVVEGDQIGWLDLYSFPLIDSATGEMTGVVEYVRNVTAEKQAQDELSAAYDQVNASEKGLWRQHGELAATQEGLQKQKPPLEEIAGTLPGVIYQYYTRPDGSEGMYYVSNRAVDIFGISSSPEDFFERFTDHVDPRDRQAFLQSIADAARDGLPWNYQGRFIRPTGEGIWFEGMSRPVRHGTELVYNGVLLDITEHKHAEDTLKTSEDTYRNILRTAMDGFCIIGMDGSFIDANDAFCKSLGYSREELLTLSLPLIEVREITEGAFRRIREIIRKGEDRFETRFRQKNGEIIDVEVSVVYTIIHGGCFIAFSRDITARKRAETAIQETNQKLNLLNNITRHDIRNQLAAAQGFTELATLTHPDAKVKEFLEKISAAIETIQSQIEFMKAYQELGMHAPAWFSVDAVIGGIRSGGIELRNTCNTIEIFADPMIDKVFFNLFDNAVKHGGRVTAITIWCEQKGEDLVIIFADNGIGIPAEGKQKIFEKGYGENTGLGLFLAREILAITGITIRETGQQGKGAVFEITVPKGAFRIAE